MAYGINIHEYKKDEDKTLIEVIVDDNGYTTATRYELDENATLEENLQSVDDNSKAVIKQIRKFRNCEVALTGIKGLSLISVVALNALTDSPWIALATMGGAAFYVLKTMDSVESAAEHQSQIWSNEIASQEISKYITIRILSRGADDK